MTLLLKKHNIIVPSSTRKANHREETEEHEETCHALKGRCSTTHAFLIDSRASNHMVALRELKFKPKGRALSSLNMESSNMCFMFPL